ncbi:MAG: plasmid recombination protein [Oscillospiraceae bacterium]
MARGDGVNRTSARNMNMTAKDISNAQRHNEREKESYTNQDIVPDRAGMNVHFKTPTGSYAEIFEQMVTDGVISTRGLKADANLYGELIFDVNSAYFHNHGGYEYARQFCADAYKAAIKIVGGEQYILSAVMHADERNRAMSEALGQDVYHYHLHVVYVPVVEKQIKWSTRCKDKSLVGTVKETVMQVSSSKKWLSKPAIDDTGTPLLTKNGKPVLKKSYSVLQDDFYDAMKSSGYSDVERGERGSSEEHLTVTQFKVEQEQARLTKLVERSDQKAQQAAELGKKIAKIQKQQTAIDVVDKIEAKALPLSSKVILERSEYEGLAVAAKKYVAQEKKESILQKALNAAHKMIAGLEAKVAALTKELSEYKSIRNKLNAVGLEQENEALRGKLHRYESVIERNSLWHLFSKNRVKQHTRDDAR